LAWEVNGNIDEIFVEIDDQVNTDQILASLSKGSLAQSIILAQADLVSAKRTLDTLMNSSLAKAQAQSALANATEALDTAEKRRESKAYQRASDQVIEEAYANYILAKDEASKWEQRYDTVDDRPEDDPVRAAALSEWAAAKQILARSEANLRYLESDPDAEEIAIAEGNLVLAQAQYDEALREWERIKDGPDPDDILAAQARIDAIQATIDAANLRAPFDAVITEVRSKTGDQVNPGSISFRLDDLSRLIVDVQIPEVDINSIKTGMTARITFDGIQGIDYNGTVIEVARVGTSVGGVVSFNVAVELNDADASVLPGMTAAVNLITSEITDVLIIPNRAVRLKDGARVVYLLKPGQLLPEATNVTIGAISDLQSEVVDGVKEGDIIVLNPPTEMLTGPNSSMGQRPF
ncbi:MAG: efflux RND transporter periplasmic adaptor subunit, partial [Anaerolineaceae bacterium]|nr:efflux RND transporter periplasmic adaptor subunit [Anaerolineaceae bacterium]